MKAEGAPTGQNFERNVYILSTGFFALFLSFNTAQALETTIVDKKALADICLATLYGLFTLMAIFAPNFVEMLGPKVSMLVGGFPYILICLSNINPSYGLSVPAFGLVGLGAALLWTGQGVYLGRCALAHSRATGEPEDAVTSRFNGTFFAAFQFNGAVGSIIAAVAFNGSKGSIHETAKWLYIGLAVSAGLGVLILTFAGRMPAERSHDDSTDASVGSVSLIETLKLAVVKPQMTLTIPIILYNGMSLGFFFSDYPLFYADAEKNDEVTTLRLMSKKNVGFVVATFYLVNSFASYGFGKVATRLGRKGCMTISTILHVIFFSLVLLCLRDDVFESIQKSKPASYAVAFGFAVVFAIGDAVWESQIPPVLQSSSFFPSERDRDAAMSNLKMWQSLGFAVQFVFGFVIKKLWIKLVILLALQILSSISLAYVHKNVCPLDAETPGGGFTQVMDDDFGSAGSAALLSTDTRGPYGSDSKP